jgi:hypothetical protein
MRSKYNAKKCNGYDSKKEAKYAGELKSLMLATDDSTRVEKIEEQVKFELIPKQIGDDGKVKERAIHYIADFVVTYGDGRVEVIDVKGYRGGAAYATYVIKRKLMLHIHKISIKEV